MKNDHIAVPMDMRLAFTAQGLELDRMNLNQYSEVERAYNLYLCGFSIGEAAEYIISMRGKV